MGLVILWEWLVGIEFRHLGDDLVVIYCLISKACWLRSCVVVRTVPQRQITTDKFEL